MIKRSTCIFMLSAVVSLLTTGSRVQAAPAQFTVDPTRSNIQMSGSAAGFKLQEQGPGSMVTTFEGTIVAAVDSDGIQFTGGSLLSARTNGVWQPGPWGASGSAPANYAAQVGILFGTLKGALRNILLDLTSGFLPVTNGQFNASELLFAFPTNSIASFDYDAGLILGSDGVPLSGAATNKIGSGATLSGPAGAQTLTIEVDAEFKFSALNDDDSSVRLVGKVVATQATALTITSIEVKNQTVTLRVQGGGSNPRLDSSANLKQWTAESPTRTTDAQGVVLTVPVNGPARFYRVVE